MKEKRQDWLITLVVVPIVVLFLVVLYHSGDDGNEGRCQRAIDTTATDSVPEDVGLY